MLLKLENLFFIEVNFTIFKVQSSALFKSSLSLLFLKGKRSAIQTNQPLVSN